MREWREPNPYKAPIAFVPLPEEAELARLRSQLAILKPALAVTSGLMTIALSLVIIRDTLEAIGASVYVGVWFGVASCSSRAAWRLKTLVAATFPGSRRLERDSTWDEITLSRVTSRQSSRLSAGLAWLPVTCLRPSGLQPSGAPSRCAREPLICVAITDGQKHTRRANHDCRRIVGQSTGASAPCRWTARPKQNGGTL
jgi:hypothetical protein